MASARESQSGASKGTLFGAIRALSNLFAGFRKTTQVHFGDIVCTVRPTPNMTIRDVLHDMEQRLDFTFPRWIVIKGRGRQTIPDTALWSTANESYLFVENGDDGSVFGNFLSIICEREGKPVPRIISSAIEYLEAHLLTVGIFRISGSQADMQDLKQKFNSGSITGFSNYPHNENDVHTIAGLLKAFIRELKDPLIPLSIYKELITIGEASPASMPDAIKAERIQTSFKNSVEAKKDPAVFRYHMCTMRSLFLFLNRLSKQSDRNKMTSDNIALIIGPNCMRPPAPTAEMMLSPHTLKAEMAASSVIIRVLVDHVESVFTDAFINQFPTSPTPQSPSASSSSLLPSSPSFSPPNAASSSRLSSPNSSSFSVSSRIQSLIDEISILKSEVDMWKSKHAAEEKQKTLLERQNEELRQQIAALSSYNASSLSYNNPPRPPSSNLAPLLPIESPSDNSASAPILPTVVASPSKLRSNSVLSPSFASSLAAFSAPASAPSSAPSSAPPPPSAAPTAAEGKKMHGKGLQCAKCKLALVGANGGENGKAVRAAGSYWHLSCFTCQKCGIALNSSFKLRENMPCCLACAASYSPS